MLSKKITRILVLVLAIVFTASLAACGGTAKPADTAKDQPKAETKAAEPEKKADAKAVKKRTFAVVFPIVHPFFEPVGVAAEKFAKEKGWDVLVKAPDKFDVQQQIEIMENLIAMKVDGIGIGATDPKALAPYVNKAVDAGIKVIAFETDTPDSKRMAYMGTDNYLAGRHLGAVLARELNNKGKVVILTGLPTQLSLNRRIDGIKDVLKEKYPDVKIIDTQSSQGDPAKAVAMTEDMIKAHSDFDVLVGIDATAGPAAVSVWKAKGWKGNEKKIITFDNMPDNIQGLKDGFITSIITQMQHTWGPKILTKLNDLCDGKEIEKSEDTGNVEITKKNIDTYMNEPIYKE